MIPEGTKVVYVTREIERALGMEPQERYQIISNVGPYEDSIKSQYPRYVHLSEKESDNVQGTTDLIHDAVTAEVMGDHSGSSNLTAQDRTAIIVFKNTSRIEAAAKMHGWELANPSSELSERVENKLSQLRWLGDLSIKYVPAHVLKVTKHIQWKQEPFIIQWAHGHTGDSTLIIRSEAELKTLQEKFPERMARLTAYIHGPSFTVNVVVTPKKILQGNVSYQITGLHPFTDNEFATIGNDWSIVRTLLSKTHLAEIKEMIDAIGLKLQKDGWKGLFGVDFILDTKADKIYLIEINARQPASTTFESFLQKKVREAGSGGEKVSTSTNGKGLTTFEAHIAALLGLPITGDLIHIKDGAQIVQRVTADVHTIPDDIAGSLELSGYQVVPYQNTEFNANLIRIQSMTGIMKDHGVFNEQGQDIIATIQP